MKSALISLISEQTQPNVLFLRQFGADATDLYFMNTTKYQIEGRANWIRYAANLPHPVSHELLLDPERLDACMQALDRASWAAYDRIIINLTGGTKMMAIAVHKHFTEKYPEKTTMYYLPVFQPAWLRIFPTDGEEPLTVHADTRDYLSSYGIHILHEANLHTNTRASKMAEQLFQELVLNNNPATLLKVQQSHSILEMMERNIYAGEWLEIWLANQIHDILGKPKSDIIQGVRISKSKQADTANNQFDVMFEYQNRLFVGECKFYNNGKFKMSGTGVAKDIYKLGSLRLNFGLHAIPFFVTANVVAGITQFEQACNFYGIKGTADKYIIRHQPDFKEFIHSLLS